MKNDKFYLPKGELKSIKNYVVSEKTSITNQRVFELKNAKRILILNDIHIPFHNLKALHIALNYGIEKKVDTIIFNGDIIDCYAISSFCRIPDKVFLKKEIDIATEIISKIRNGFKRANIIYKTGNHEERLEKYLYTKPEIFNLECLKWENLLGLNQNRIFCLNNKELIKAGKTYIAHGHEFKGGGQNPARSLIRKYSQNLIFGHHHRSCEEFEVDLYNNRIEVFGIGCLSELSPDYLPNNQWNLGFGYLEILDNKGNYKFLNHRIIKNKIY